MEHAFSYIMFAFGGGILIYALFVLIFGFSAIRKNYTVKLEEWEKRGYANRFAGVLALVALAPIIGGGLGYVLPAPATGIAIVVLFVFFIWLGTKIMKRFFE